jgi:AsmA protein
MNIKKISLIVLGSFVGLLVLAMAYLMLIMDPNDYKPEIISQVKLSSNRDLTIEGDISWRFFPNVGFTIGHTQINSPEGFPSKPLLEFESAQIDLALLPLLNKRIEVGLISINELSLYIHTRKDGVSNLTQPPSTHEKDTKTNAAEVAETQSSTPSINDLAIDGIQVNNANIVIENLAEQSEQSLTAVNFELGSFELEKAVSLTFSALINTGDISAEINSSGQIMIDQQLQKFDLINLITTISAKGEALPKNSMDIVSTVNGYFDSANQVVNFDTLDLSLLDIDINGKFKASLAGIPNLEYDVNISDIDLDKILEGTESSTEVKNAEESQAIDLTWMKSFNAKGLLTIKSVKANNLTVSNIRFPMELKNSLMQLNPINAELYEGALLANIVLNAKNTVPAFSFKSTLKDVQALPLVKDLMAKEVISGTANMQININGYGLEQLSLRKNTKGSGEFAFSDGAIHGVNVAELIRNGYAKIKGHSIEITEQSDQTDFASFTGSFNLADGIISNQDLSLLSPLLRISGDGTANIIDESVNYKLKTSIVGSLEGQGGKPIKDLKNLTIPLKIKGSMAEPDISIDMDDLFKTKLKEKLKDKLKDLFGD